MRLAIDAKWYFNGPPSGRNVVRNIIDNLFINDFDFDIYLILNKSDYEMNKIFKKKIHESKIKIILTNSSINFLTNLFSLNKKLVKEDIDIVLLQNFLPIFKSKKIIYVNYVHDFLFLDYPNFFTRTERFIYSFIKYSTKKADHIITISRNESDRIKKHLPITKNKISYVYHGIDQSFRRLSKTKIKSVKNKFSLPENYILYVGRINVRKNLKVLLDAQKLIKSHLKIIIIGGSQNDGGLKKTIESYFKNNVKIMGHLKQKDLADILASSSMLVFPSLAEGFGLPPLEAMRSGVPVIVSDLKIHREICSDAALYFNPESSIDLAKKIDLIFNNLDKKTTLISMGKNRSNFFHWANSVEKIFNILKDLYAKKNC